MYKETTRLAQDEEGVVYYCISRDQKDPSIFHFFERYKSKDAFRKHNEQAVVIRLINSGVTRDITASFAKAVEF